MKICGHFFIFSKSTRFLDLPAKDWSFNPQVEVAKEVVASFSVVNDQAERGIALTHDFLDAARKEDNLQNIL